MKSDYKFPSQLKRAKKAGQRDGKNEVPKPDWNQGSIPFLNLLHKRYVELQETNILGFRSRVRQLEEAQVEAKQRVIENEASASMATSQLQEAVEQANKIQAQIDGELEDMPSSLPAKRRNLNTWAYSLIVAVCILAELTVTIPALQFLLGEKRQFAVLLALALGTGTFFSAHIIGTTLKKRQDRSVPQPVADIVLVSILSGIIVGAIFFLAYVRANQSLPFAGNFVELPESWKLEVLWALWFIWQMTFFFLGSVAAFKHHSETASQLMKAKRMVRLRKFQNGRAQAGLTKSQSKLKTLEIDWTTSLDRRVDEMKQQERQLQAQYLQACALYVDSNIHARRQSIKGDHPAFVPPELEPKELDFLGQAPNNPNRWDISQLGVAGSTV
jgi:hypothetical protein